MFITFQSNHAVAKISALVQGDVISSLVGWTKKYRIFLFYQEITHNVTYTVSTEYSLNSQSSAQ